MVAKVFPEVISQLVSWNWGKSRVHLGGFYVSVWKVVCVSSSYIFWLELSHNRGWIMQLRHVPREKRGWIQWSAGKIPPPLFGFSCLVYPKSLLYVQGEHQMPFCHFTQHSFSNCHLHNAGVGALRKCSLSSFGDSFKDSSLDHPHLLARLVSKKGTSEKVLEAILLFIILYVSNCNRVT